MDHNSAVKAAILATAFALYLAITTIYVDGIGSVVLLSAAAPIAVAGLLYGVRGGMAMAIVTVIGGTFVTGGPAQLDGYGPALVRTLTGLAMGWLTGSLGSANRRINAELSSRIVAERELARSEEQYRVMAETASDGIISIDGAGQVTYANPAIQRILGYDPSDLVGGPLTTIIPESLRAAHGAAFARYLGGGERTLPWDSIQVPGLHAAGHDVPLELSFGELRTAEEVVFTGIIRDMTERQRTAAKLEALLDSKDQFIAAVSHELRTPLTAVVGFASELRTHLDDLSPDVVRELVGMVADQASDVANLVEDLLVAARAETDQLVIIPSDVDLTAEARQVLQEGVRCFDGTAMPVDFRPSAVLAVADGIRVRQIVRNLLTNAARYGKPPVTLTMSQTADAAMLVVADHGPGVPGGHEALIFDAYHRLDEMVQPGSVGLGLTISHRLAGLMNGDLSYERTNGETRFVLSLPIVDSARAATVA